MREYPAIDGDESDRALPAVRRKAAKRDWLTPLGCYCLGSLLGLWVGWSVQSGRVRQAEAELHGVLQATASQALQRDVERRAAPAVGLGLPIGDEEADRRPTLLPPAGPRVDLSGVAQ